MTEEKQIEVNNFLEDLRVGDIIFELENFKLALKEEALTETEKAGAVLIALAERYSREDLIKAMREDNRELLDEVLSCQLLEAEENENELIRARFKACNDGNLVEKTVDLILSIGGNNIRYMLELTDDKDLEEYEEEQIEKVDNFIKKLEELKKEELTRKECSGLAILLFAKVKLFGDLFEALTSDSSELLTNLLKTQIDKIKDKEYTKNRYNQPEQVVKATVDLVEKIGKDVFKTTLMETLNDLDIDEDIIFNRE
ncbi:hypothetical protein [uncultured Fusobacterium sp.]|uniref:hypothetical protein n=1 Tax=uncultured Fusobacterium sp. TaxID=159267 RepID=UPI0015A549B9|nr:hypothetical protein [uncultured Fusobacterium sp.]